MASPKRPKSATSTRKRKAAGEDPGPTPSTDPDELSAVERDPEQPLSLLPKERRGIAAQERILQLIVNLERRFVENQQDHAALATTYS